MSFSPLKRFSAVLLFIGLASPLVAPLAAQRAATNPTLTPKDLRDIYVGNPGTRRTSIGNIVDLDCFLVRGGFGKDHLQCTKECAHRGLPQGFLDESGTLYMILNRIHTPLQQVNSTLEDLLESTVELTGDFITAKGANVVMVDRLKKASRQAPADEIERRRKRAMTGGE